MSSDYDEIDGHDYARRATANTCDADCMGANHCSGFEVCSDCGRVMCGCELDEHGLCEECAEKHADDEYNEAVFAYCSKCVHYKECDYEGRYDCKQHCTSVPKFKNDDAVNEECDNYEEAK